MSDRGNLEWIATKVAEIDRQLKDSNDGRLDAFTSLLSSIESSLADVVDNIERGGGAAAIEAMAEALKALKLPEASVNLPPMQVDVHVPEQKAPVVNVQVQPTPVTVEAVLPAQPAPIVHVTTPDQTGATWEIRMPGMYGAPDRTMTITRKR